MASIESNNGSESFYTTSNEKLSHLYNRLQDLKHRDAMIDSLWHEHSLKVDYQRILFENHKLEQFGEQAEARHREVLSALSQEKDDLQTSLRQARNNNSELITKVEKLKKELRTLKQSDKQLQSKIQELESQDNVVEQLKQLCEEQDKVLASLREKHAQAQKHCDTLENAQRDMQRKMNQKDKEILNLKDMLGKKDMRIEELKDNLRSIRRKQTRAMAKYESYSDDDPNYLHSDDANSAEDESAAILAEAMRKARPKRPTRQTRQTRRASKEEPSAIRAAMTDDRPTSTAKGKTRSRAKKIQKTAEDTKGSKDNTVNTTTANDRTTRGKKDKGKERAFAMPLPTIPSPSPAEEPEQQRQVEEEAIPEAFHDAPHESDEYDPQEEAAEVAPPPEQEQANEAQPEEEEDDMTGADRSPILGDSMDDFQPPVTVRKSAVSPSISPPEPASDPAPEVEPEAPPAKPTRRRRMLRDRKRALPDPEFDMSPLSKVNKTVKDG
ncbi:hypothetical protein BCR43DRAFT_527205 [Syncephalastrum racemosum]|uniref:Uncharacterized protein n=1 Tax=Syncephalastrum racemosum TaxID=13706 RepID=A0A1X2H2C1_SYNRA|nr:hypothetical protein BCR43DRAFT_527205 [Syncephalastrum racemosum]